MNNSRLWLAATAVILLAVFGASLRHGGPFQTPQTQTLSASGAVIWSHGPDGSDANAQEHWQKHGGEFPALHSEQDYVGAANAFVHRPPPGTLTKTDSRGDTLFYDPATNTFAVMDSAGEPRTFFKPDNGRAYWDRQ